MFVPSTIERTQTIKKATNLRVPKNPKKPPKMRRLNYIFFEGVPIMRGNELVNKNALIKNGYILKKESFLIRHYSYSDVKKEGEKLKPENTTVSPEFIGNFKLYLKVNIKNNEIRNDSNKLIYRKSEFIKIQENETFESIYSNSKIKVENLNTHDIKKEILKQKNFDLSDWNVDHNNSSFIHQKFSDSSNDFYKETDKDVRQGKFISFKKYNRYLFFFFKLDTHTFDSSKLSKISLSNVAYDLENNKIKTNYEKYIATFSLLTQINEKQLDFDKAILKRFKRDDKEFLLVAYGDIFKIILLEKSPSDKHFETFLKLLELTHSEEINLFKKDKIEFTLAEIKRTFEEFSVDYQIDELEISNQLSKLKTHNETIGLNFYAKNNLAKTVLKTLKLKFKPAQEIEKLDLTFKTNDNYFITDDEKTTSFTSETLKKKTFSDSTTTLSSLETTLYTGFETDIKDVITTIKEQLKNILNKKEYEIYSTEDKNGNFLFSIQKHDTGEVRVFKVRVRRISRDDDFYELNRLFMFDYYQTEHNIQEILNYFNSITDIFNNLNLEIKNYTELNAEINKLKVNPYTYKKLKLILKDKYSNVYSVNFFGEIRYGSSVPLKVLNSFLDAKHTRFFMSSNLAFASAVPDLFGSYDLKMANQYLRQWFDNESENFVLSELNKTFKVNYNFFKKDYFAMQTNLNSYILYLNKDLDYSEQELQAIFINIFGKNLVKIEKNQHGCYFIYLNNFREKQIVYLKHSTRLSKYRVSKEITKERISELFKSVSDTNKNSQKVIETLESILKNIPELKITKENTENSAVTLKIYSTLNKEVYKTFTVV